jgi:hypothetical protein
MNRKYADKTFALIEQEYRPIENLEGRFNIYHEQEGLLCLIWIDEGLARLLYDGLCEDAPEERDKLKLVSRS